MNAWVLLLRGINVGGHNKLPMAELRTILKSLGVKQMRTVVQTIRISASLSPSLA